MTDTHSPRHPHRSSPAESGSPHTSDARRALGRLGEELAAQHFLRLGFSILARNVRTRYGEIDLIAFNGNALVFAEVKTRRCCRRQRRSLDPGHDPLAGLSVRQRARLRLLAMAWLISSCTDRPRADVVRFDAVGVVVDGKDRLISLDHVEGAW